MNTLYYGDNLGILRNYLSDESVDLVYLDPPFNSKADYNILFKEQSGEPSQGQIKAFTDTWKWSEQAYAEFIEDCNNDKLQSLVDGFINTLGRNDVTAYLVLMAPRLMELHRVLKPSGSLYLHCDPTASHYLKLVLDCVFKPTNFRSEIVWKRTSAHSASKRWNDIHDTIFFYTKGDAYIWNQVLTEHSEQYTSRYRNRDSDGRFWADDNLTGPGTRRGDSGAEWRGYNPTEKGAHWKVSLTTVISLVGETAAKNLSTTQKLDLLDEHGFIHWPKSRTGGSGFPRFKRYLSAGVSIQDLVTDISPINSQAAERLGYPTQKPQALLERIIKASSNEGDVVLDPFCGCGTAVVAAQALKRNWIGIDITHLAVSLIQARLRDSFDQKPGEDYQVVGVPETASAARVLAEKDRFEFQKWAVSLVPNAYPTEAKSGDQGIDGRVNFTEIDEDGKTVSRKIVLQVKSGKLKLGEVRDFAHVIEREKAALGFFVTLDPPSKNMLTEAGTKGFFSPANYPDKRIPVYQIKTVGDLLEGKQFELPPTLGLGLQGIQRAKRQHKKTGSQDELSFE